MSIAELVAGVIDDLKALIRQEIALAREEIRGEVSKVRTAIASSAAAIGLAIVGALLLILMLVHALHALGLPLWASYGLVGVLLMVAAGVLAARAKRAAGSFHLVPPATARTVKENVTWLKERAILRRG